MKRGRKKESKNRRKRGKDFVRETEKSAKIVSIAKE